MSTRPTVFQIGITYELLSWTGERVHPCFDAADETRGTPWAASALSVPNLKCMRKRWGRPSSQMAFDEAQGLLNIDGFARQASRVFVFARLHLCMDGSFESRVNYIAVNISFPIGRKSAGQFFMSNLKRKYEQFSLTRGKR